jgi:glutamine cyclotransferase
VRLPLTLILCVLPGIALAVEQLGIKVLDRKPQDQRYYVQGLEIHDGEMYLSTGLYGQSKLIRYDFDTGRLNASRSLNPRLFGEGLTVLNNTVFQLTWKQGIVLVYDQEDLKFRDHFRIPGEGWGMTNNGTDIIYSDGSAKLHYLSPDKREIARSITVTEGGKPVRQLNELEWIDGKVWANVWQSERIVIIDPDTGEVTASIDLSSLVPSNQRQVRANVLNGIARDPRDNSVWVTGKRWSWQYRIETVPAQ